MGDYAQEATYGSLGYGYHRFSGGLVAGKTYVIVVYDWAGVGEKDITLTLYAEKSEVQILLKPKQ